MKSYEQERYWADQYIPEIKKTLGLVLLDESSFAADTREATDLITFYARSVRIACRIRRPLYYRNETWRWQFTIRADLPSGNQTELAKIREGWGDIYFYAFACEGDKIALDHWRALSLAVFRRHEAEVPFQQCRNLNGSEFRAYHIDDFPRDLVIATSEPTPRDARHFKPNATHEVSVNG